MYINPIITISSLWNQTKHNSNNEQNIFDSLYAFIGKLMSKAFLRKMADELFNVKVNIILQLEFEHAS